MKKESPQHRLETFVRKELDKSVQDFDSDTLARLRTARNKAVLVSQEHTHGNTHGIFAVGNWWLPVGGFAATAAVVALSLSLWVVEPNLPNLISFEDMAVLSANEDLDMFDELEFYQWLDDEKHSHS